MSWKSLRTLYLNKVINWLCGGYTIISDNFHKFCKKMPTTFESMLENGSSADVVAKVVLNAVTSEKSHVFKKT